MNKKLAGTLLIKNGVMYDYCFEAAIKSLQALCNHVFIVYVESDDNTLEILNSLMNDKTTILTCKKEDWDNHAGRTKLSLFTNVGIEYAQQQGYEYQFNLQSDECLDTDSFPYIIKAIELGEEGYIITRHNLWGNTSMMLNVPQSKKPVSTQICRLTKTGYRSFDDAESVNCPASLDFINLIQVWHLGFVRDGKKHIAKIKEIQKNIFQMENYDSRADLKEEFDWKDWGFTEQDLIPIHKPLPNFLDEWIKDK